MPEVQKYPIHKVKKEWGDEEWLVNTPLYCYKALRICGGFRSSLHYHQQKDETFLVESGKIRLELGTKVFILEVGDSIRIGPGVRHRFESLARFSFVLEISTHHDDEDVVRLVPSGPSKGE